MSSGKVRLLTHAAPLRLWWLTLSVLLNVSPVLAQDEGKRVALVIGNEAYASSPLKNGVNDARLIDRVLRDAGFRTILRENATKPTIELAIADLVKQIGPDDTALFYFAGHGIQIQQENFLIPVDFAASDSVIEAKYKSVSLPQLIENIASKSPKRTIIILDACRSSPVAEAHSLQAGLAQPLKIGDATYLAFATSPGNVAGDNPNGRNGFFTEALADFMAQPGLSIDQVFSGVRNRVSQATGRKQNPWSNNGLIGDTFYFHPPAKGQEQSGPQLVEKWVDDAERAEELGDWTKAIETWTQVEKSPSSSLAPLASQKVRYLKLRRDADAKYNAEDYIAAGELFAQALEVDPLAADAALRGAASFLLADRLTEGARLLRLVRQRGATSLVRKAEAMLGQLAALSAEADQELKAGSPTLPKPSEVLEFLLGGPPDFAAGAQYIKSHPAEIARSLQTISWAPESAASRDLEPAPHLVADLSVPPRVSGPLQQFHVEIISVSESRDLGIQPASSVRPISQNYGFLKIAGLPENTPVLWDGKAMASDSLYRFQLPAGQYEVRAVEMDKVLNRMSVRIEALRYLEITISR